MGASPSLDPIQYIWDMSFDPKQNTRKNYKISTRSNSLPSDWILKYGEGAVEISQTNGTLITFKFTGANDELHSFEYAASENTLSTENSSGMFGTVSSIEASTHTVILKFVQEQEDTILGVTALEWIAYVLWDHLNSTNIQVLLNIDAIISITTSSIY